MSPEKLKRLVEIMDRSSGSTSRSRWPDLVVAASVALVFMGLVLAGVPVLRERQHRIACENRLRELHGGLESYASLHSEKYPWVNEQPPHHTAGSYWSVLRSEGHLPAEYVAQCPGSDTESPLNTYAYALGYRDDTGRLRGYSRNQGMDLLPLVADRPPADRIGVGPDHGGGQNVLFIGGNVRFCTSSHVGANGDDIFRNARNTVGAGLHLWDSVLGIGNDQP